MLSTLPGRLSATLGRAVFAAALLLAAPAALAAEQEAAGEQADGLTSLRYGVSLYYFYQQDYFDALSELMVAQQLGELATHAAHSELLRAGMSLSYGMDRVAESLFQQMLAQSGPTVDRDKAWFYLAKIAWQRGELARAEAALASMSPGYDGSLAAEADYLRASISLRRGDLAQATSLAARLPEDSPWRYYLDYNLGAALAAGGDWSAAIAAFQRLAHSPCPPRRASPCRTRPTPPRVSPPWPRASMHRRPGNLPGCAWRARWRIAPCSVTAGPMRNRTTIGRR